MDASHLVRLNAARRARKPVVLVTDLDGGGDYIFTEGDDVDAAFEDAVTAAFRSGKASTIIVNNRQHFLNIYLPPLRIVIIGAVHISQVLAPMAALAGFSVRVIDPRTAFATQERFEGVDLCADWPEDVLVERPLDAFTALVAVTHDPKIDDGPIAEALRAGCVYIGALGSRKTHSSRITRLSAQGFGEAELARICGPIGLDIGAAGPAEIAVSVLAEIIQVVRSPGGLRSTEVPGFTLSGSAGHRG